MNVKVSVASDNHVIDVCHVLSAGLWPIRCCLVTHDPVLSCLSSSGYSPPLPQPTSVSLLCSEFCCSGLKRCALSQERVIYIFGKVTKAVVIGFTISAIVHPTKSVRISPFYRQAKRLTWTLDIKIHSEGRKKTLHMIGDKR